MRIKVKDNEVNIPTWLAMFALLTVDNMYANHCKKKTLKKYVDTVKDLDVEIKKD